MSRSGPVGVGFIGTGMISDTYLDNLTSFPDVRVVIVGGRNQARAQAQAQKHDVAESGTSDDVLDHPDVEIVVNLTVPAVHASVASQAVAAGKHVWSEKPISIDRESGRALLDQADAADVLVDVAPDTVLGPGIQTARRAIARGDIGVPLSAQTVMQYADSRCQPRRRRWSFSALGAHGCGPRVGVDHAGGRWCGSGGVWFWGVVVDGRVVEGVVGPAAPEDAGPARAQAA
jgi:predicted dehydrogenase